MRISFALTIIVAVLTISTTAQAQSWQYEEKAHPFTDEVESVGASVESLDGGFSVGCLNDLGLVVGALFNEFAEELESARESDDNQETAPTVNIKWRINRGEIQQFSTSLFDGAGYGVAGSMAVEMARKLMDAREFATSNGGEGASERILHFENLDGGEQIGRVLEACRQLQQEPG